jgi:putative flippase GtrA
MREKWITLYKRYEEIMNYLIAGGLTTLVSLLVYYGSVLTILDPENALQLQAANVLSWVFAVAFAYVVNRTFVFHSKNTSYQKEILSFVSSRIVTLFMDMGCMFLLVTVLHGNDKAAKLLVQVIVTVGNYVLSKCLVFRERKEEAHVNDTNA